MYWKSIFRGSLEIEPWLRVNLNRSVFVTLNDEQLQQIDPIMSQLAHHCIEKGMEHMPFKNALAILLVGYLSERFLVNRPILLKEDRNITASILNAMDYLHRHYHEKLSVDALAKQANVSRTAFYQHFFDINGCSVIQYLTGYRLRQSLTLLQNTKKSIADIAQECGFYDSSHYIRNFIKTYQITPRQYRQGLPLLHDGKTQSIMPTVSCMHSLSPH